MNYVKTMMESMIFFCFLTSTVLAGAKKDNLANKTCGQLLLEASVKAAADDDCRAGAKSLVTSLKGQVKKCKKFHKLLSNCRKSKREEKKLCKKATSKAAKKACKKATKARKKACKKEAKTTKKFERCKSARALTKQALGSVGRCAVKYYLVPVGLCIVKLASEASAE